MAETPPSPETPAAPAPADAAQPATITLSRRWRDLAAFTDPRAAIRETVRQRRRELRVFLLLGGLLLFAGTFAGLLSWVHPVAPAFFVPLWITEYESRQLPINAQADPDRAALRSGGYFSRIDENAFSSQERHLLMQDLVSLKDERSGPVIVYLCAFACRGEGGAVYLFPADVRPDYPSTRLALSQVFQAIENCPASHKLLILDLMRPVAAARLGILEDDAAAAVHDEVQAELQALQKNGKDPRALGLVLCPCAPGQVALTSDVLGRSIFGYYLEDGLRGWAASYSERGIRNNRVTVEELANYVRLRVDRWAVRLRGTRQTPVLLGAGRPSATATGADAPHPTGTPCPDFALVALDHGRPQPHLEVPAARPYPAWLRDGWKLRDAWMTQINQHPAPRLVLQLQAALLQFEQEWRDGVDVTRVENDLKLRVEEFRTRDQRARSLIPHPNPRSLAAAVAQGAVPDQAVAAELRTLLQTIEQQDAQMKPADAATAKEKAVQAFVAKNKAKSYFDLAWAAFDVLSTEPEPTVAKVLLINDLLEQRQSSPVYLEVHFIRRLTALAADGGEAAWPRQVVRLALEVERKGGEASVSPEAMPWLRGLHERAVLLRFRGDLLLFSRGYAPLSAASDALKEARDVYEVILNYQDTLREGLRLQHRAFSFLPVYATYLESNPANERLFGDAIHATDELTQALAPPRSGPPLAEAALRDVVKDVARKAQALRFRLEDLNWPFEADRIASLITQSRQPDASVPLLAASQAILDTPFLRADDRIALMKARYDLGQRLEEAVRELDVAEDERGLRTAQLVDFALEQTRFEAVQNGLARLRARTSLAILRLGGIDAAEVFTDPVERRKALQWSKRTAGVAESSPVTQHDVGEHLRLAWATVLPARLQQESDLYRQSRLAAIVPPPDVLPLVDDPTTNPSVRRHAQELREMLTALVDLYRYVSRDSADGSFFAEVAIEYQRVANLEPATYLQTAATATVPPLNRFNPSFTLDLRLTLFTTAKAKPQLTTSILTPDNDWLRVRVSDAALEPLRVPGEEVRSCTVPVRIELKPGAELSRSPRPRGFIVFTQVDGLSFHHKVSLQSLPLPLDERVEAQLSANPAAPTAPVENLRLRPVGRQPYYLYVRNTTKKPRNLLVQLKVKDTVLKGGEAKVVVPPDSFRPVPFNLPLLPPVPAAGAPATPAAAPAVPDAAALLPDFTGPLHVLVLDADHPTDVLDEKLIAVGIASPREYVRITEVRFSPPGAGNDGKNRLEAKLRPVGALSGAPCRIQLVLPPDRIPGFISARDGSFVGVLPTDGSDLLLYANNVRLDEGSPPDGYFYLNVDSLERAFIFRTTFARQGEPTTPREDVRPAIRLRADRFSRSLANYPVRIEVDNPPPGASLELLLTRAAGGAFETDVVKKIPHARHHHLGFSTQSPDGALLFEAVIQDAATSLDARGLQGARELRAVLLDRGGAEIASARLGVAFDDSPPDRVRFVAAPSEAVKNSLLPLQARGVDPESGIAKVVFFLGKPTPDGKVPPTVPSVEGEPNPVGTEWSGKLQLLGDRRGPTDISVQFVNSVGLSTFATTTIDLLDAPTKPGPGRIAGVVQEGERPQGDLEVSLSRSAAKTPDEKKPQTTKTKPDGTFAFENLAPGNYVVSSTKVTSGRKGTQTVEVQAGQTAMVTISLFE